MTFFSFEFLGFLAGSLLLYYLLPKKVQWVVLLSVSLCFYLLGGAWMGLYLLFTILTTYAAGLLLWRLNRSAKHGGASVKGRKRLVLTAALVLDFGLLFVLKYWNATGDLLGSLTGGRLTLPKTELLLPLGLSFYLFQSVGYVIDCYRGNHPVEKNPLKYALFVCFFPQMIQGPISRHRALAPQLVAEHRFDADNLRKGIQLALWGYLKKLLLADRAAIAVGTVFGAPERYGGAMYAFAVLLYCVQLYCDFSGGIDITRGVAQMFGIDLAENFRRPIFATTLADYWRRWHITLGEWMRDYVFYPLSLSKPIAALSRATRKRFSGKLGKVIPTACATFVVYLIIGIWHGSSLKYLFYGLYNGVLLTSSVLLAKRFSSLRKRLKLDGSQWYFRAFQMLRTMLIVFIGRYITRAGRLMLAFSMLKKTVFSPCLYQLSDGSLGRLGLAAQDYLILGLGVAVLLVAEWRQEKGVQLRDSLAKKPALVQWLFMLLPLLLLLYTIAFSGSAVDATMIYQQF